MSGSESDGSRAWVMGAPGEDLSCGDVRLGEPGSQPRVAAREHDVGAELEGLGHAREQGGRGPLVPDPGTSREPRDNHLL